MVILLYKIEISSKFSLFLPFCMIEHDFVPIQENDEKSQLFHKFKHQKMTILLLKFSLPKYTPFAFTY